MRFRIGCAQWDTDWDSNWDSSWVGREGGWVIVLAGVGLRSNGLWLTDYVAAGEAVGDVAQLAFPAETHKN